MGATYNYHWNLKKRHSLSHKIKKDYLNVSSQRERESEFSVNLFNKTLSCIFFSLLTVNSWRCMHTIYIYHTGTHHLSWSMHGKINNQPTTCLFHQLHLIYNVRFRSSGENIENISSPKANRIWIQIHEHVCLFAVLGNNNMQEISGQVLERVAGWVTGIIILKCCCY